MKQNNIQELIKEKAKNSLCLVTEDFLERIIFTQDKILDLLQAKSSNNLNGYITERQAKEILNKKATWFWQIRKANKLPFKRIGKTVYYKLDDISSLLEKI